MGKQVPLEPYWFDVAFVEVDLRCSLVYLIGHVGLIFFFSFSKGLYLRILIVSFRSFADLLKLLYCHCVTFGLLMAS